MVPEKWVRIPKPGGTSSGQHQTSTPRTESLELQYLAKAGIWFDRSGDFIDCVHIPVEYPVIYFAVILFVIGLLLLAYTRKSQRESGIPGGKVIYLDTDGWKPVESPLFDPTTRLVGRPDYLVRSAQEIIPVEVKSSRISDNPLEGHTLQLAAYCRLVEHEYHVRPSHGIINYPEKTFSVDYSPELEQTLYSLLNEIRSIENWNSVKRSHDSAARCRACGYRSICYQKI